MRLPIEVRRFTTSLLRGIPVRVKEGPNEGCRWSLAAAGRHRRGRFENDRIEAIRALVSAGECVWDAGAHHGYVTLAVSRILGPAGRVYAFEPSSYNLAFLRTHVRWNAASNVEIVPAALGGEDGVARFGGRGSSQSFRLGGGGDTVETRSLPTLVADGLRPPDFLKLDVEGAEGEILEAAASHLPSTGLVMVSVHSPDAYERSVAALAPHGFDILESPPLRRLRASDHWGHDPDFLAVGPGRRELLERARRLPYFTE